MSINIRRLTNKESSLAFDFNDGTFGQTVTISRFTSNLSGGDSIQLNGVEEIHLFLEYAKRVEQALSLPDTVPADGLITRVGKLDKRISTLEDSAEYSHKVLVAIHTLLQKKFGKTEVDTEPQDQVGYRG